MIEGQELYLEDVKVKQEEDGFNLIFRFDGMTTIIFCGKGKNINCVGRWLETAVRMGLREKCLLK